MNTKEDYKFFGMDAQALKDNRVLKQVFTDLRELINRKELNVSITEIDQIQKLIMMRQTLADIDRIIDRYILDGQLAAEALEKELQKPIVREFRR